MPETKLIHGGRLREMAQRHDIPLSRWLDLSTGINPVGWPVPPLAEACWRRLPESEDGLEAAARAYYGAKHLLPVAGSQAAIQLLPKLRPRGRVGILAPSYAEHGAAWREGGHTVVDLTVDEVGRAVEALDTLVLVNPNNPTGQRFSPEQLLVWHRRLSERGGWLVVDEAFMDTTPEGSVALATGRPGLVVLRSLGKFFGLAGVRVGFVLAWPALLGELEARLGPWSVSGPGREVARLALADGPWQGRERLHLAAAAERLHHLLAAHGLPPTGGTALFQWVRHPEAERLAHGLARLGIYVRRFETPPSLRFGLPAGEAEWARLAGALEHLVAR